MYKNKGQRNDPDNYRGITLLSCIGKLFTSCLNHRLCSYIECQQIIGNEQADFRSGHSTIDHIFALRTLIDLYLNNKKTIILCINPIRSGLFHTVNDPGGGTLKAPPPYDLENYSVNLHHIIHVHFTRCFWHDPIGIFPKFAILTILQRFQNKK